MLAAWNMSNQYQQPKKTYQQFIVFSTSLNVSGWQITGHVEQVVEEAVGDVTDEEGVARHGGGEQLAHLIPYSTPRIVFKRRSVMNMQKTSYPPLSLSCRGRLSRSTVSS